MFLTTPVLLLAVACLQSVTTVHSFEALHNYPNDFVNPSYVLSKNYNATTAPAQQTIIQWADSSSQGGPWSVTSKPYLAPSGDKHDYMSWAPYAWPDCSKVGNKTQLTPQQIWSTCPYVTKDGQFNPDNSDIEDSDNFDNLANAVLYNSIAWGIKGDSTYSGRVTAFIQAWFLNPDTYMNPNLNYAQMQRGPDGQVGTHTGILDLKCMAKIASGVLILRNGKSPDWTSDIDTQFVSWINKYISWITSSDIALKEKASTNNHGSFYYTQLASLQVMAGNTSGAQETLSEYFDGIYMNQIAANGDQPLESQRTRPYHYRAYNLAAMITNARLAAFVGLNVWNKPTSTGATIQQAANFAMTTNSTSSSEAEELFIDVAAVASEYGDPNNTYAKWLFSKDYSDFVQDAFFFWDQPLSDLGYAANMNKPSSSTTKSKAPKPTGIQWDPSPPANETSGNIKKSAAFATSLGLEHILTTLGSAVLIAGMLL